jgi:hypothetical protein
MEQEGLRELITTPLDARQLGTYWQNDPGTLRAAQSRVPAFVCPSDQAWERTGNCIVRMRNLVLSVGVVQTRWESIANENSLGRTNYAGVAGYQGYLGQAMTVPAFPPNPPSLAGIQIDAMSGIFTNRSAYPANQIQDGLSNTLMFGEALFKRTVSPTGTIDDNNSASWMGTGIMVTEHGLNGDGQVQTFSSNHPGIVQFCLADGSVRQIRKDISFSTYVFLSGIRDGKAVSLGN